MQNAIGFRDFMTHESRKVFQRRFMNHDYFIRCVKKWDEITEIYGEHGIGHLADARYPPESWTTLRAY